MSKPKLTGWLNCRKQPVVHVGKYDVRLWEPGSFAPQGRRYFDGTDWFWRKGGEKMTGNQRPGWHHKDEYRGLTEPSK